MHDFGLTEEHLKDLQADYRRSPYQGEPPIIQYKISHVRDKAIQVLGSKGALEKLQETIKKQRRKIEVLEQEFVSEKRKPPDRDPRLAGSFKVIAWATCANGTDMLCKGVGWLFTGSHSMFAEMVHSAADTLNQAFLFFGIKRSAKKPDKYHPYGYANFRYVTSLIAGMGILFCGTGLNIYHGISALLYLDPLDMFAPDSAALFGVVIAGSMLGLSAVLGSPIPDAIGSLMIGGLLGLVAFNIVKTNAAHLVIRSVPEREKEDMVCHLEKDPMIRSVHDVKATEMGLEEVRLKAELDIDGRKLTEIYLAQQDIAHMLVEIQSLKTEEQLRRYLQHFGAGVVDRLGEEVDRIEQDLQDYNLLYWITPNGKVLKESTAKYSVDRKDYKLEVRNVENQDVGTYTCIAQMQSNTTNLLEQPVMIPYAYPVKNYLISGSIGVAAAVCFLLLAGGSVLLDRYKWRPPEDAEGDNNFVGYNQADTIQMDVLGPRPRVEGNGVHAEYGNPAFSDDIIIHDSKY